MLITETDEQFRQLKQSDPLLPEVLGVLRACGVTEPQLSWVSTRAVSRETLDNHFNGSWLNWLR